MDTISVVLTFVGCVFCGAFVQRTVNLISVGKSATPGETANTSASCNPSRSYHIHNGYVHQNILPYICNNRIFLVKSKFQQGWKAGTLCPTVKGVYQIIENQASIDSYYAYLFVLHANHWGVPNL